MKIRTQLIISTVFFAVALAFISASVIFTNQQVERLNKQEELAKNIELEVGELSYLSNDYLLYHESQQIDRWESKYSTISDDISNLTVSSPEQQVLVDAIKASGQRLKDIFADMVLKIENEPEDQPNTADPDFIQVSWSRMGVQTQGIVFDASRLSEMLQEEADQARQQNNLLILALLGAFVAFLFTDYLLIFRRTLKSVSELQDGTRVIGSGNLDYSLAEKKGDEISELAHAFNLMTANLKTVTASKAELEREVVERKQAEEALHQAYGRLQTFFDHRIGGIGIVIANARGDILQANDYYLSILGCTREELLSGQVDWRKTTPPEWLPADERALAQLRERGVSDTYEKEYVRRDGTRVPVLITDAMMPGDSGDILAFVFDITERKQAEEQRQRLAQELADRVAELQAILDAAPVAVWIAHDPQCQQITGNAYADQILQAPRGGNVSRSALPKEAAVSYKVFRNDVELQPEDMPAQVATATGMPVLSDELELILPDGQTVHLMESAMPLFDAEGQVRGAVIAGADVTQLKLTEESLRESEERLRSLAENVPCVLMRFDRQLRVVYLSKQSDRYNPNPVERMIGRTNREMGMPEELCDLWDAAIERVFRTGAQEEMEFGFAGPSGMRTFSLTFAPEFGRDREIRYVLGVSSDITERKHAEAALRESEEKFSIMFHATPIATVLATVPEGRIHDVNDAWLHLTGFKSKEEALGKTSDDLGLAQDEEARERILEEFRLNGMVSNAEMTFRDSAGLERIVLVGLSPVNIGGSKFLLSTNLDITERKKADEALRASLAEKEVLLKEIHHRVKNNMQVISSLISLQTGSPATSKSDQAVARALEDLRGRVRAMALVHEKLYQSQNMSRIDFAAYAESLLRSVWRANAIDAARVELRLQLQPMLLSADSAVPCGLILNELATNALKHAFPSREGVVTVSLLNGADGQACLKVSDNGIGLPADLDWQQSQTLGLQLVSMLTRQLGGTIEVDSRQGEGTEFRITLA